MTAENRAVKLEFSPPDEIRRVQELLLKEHLCHAAANSPYYRKLFGEMGMDVSGINLESLATIPLTEKMVLGSQNEDFLAVPMAEIVDIVLSSGTTGRSTTVMYTENDLGRLAYNEEISFAGCGLTRDDTVLLTCT